MFKLLEKTYNTSILNNLSPQQQKQYIEKGFAIKSPVLEKLIHNHYYLDKPEPNYIAGPKTLSLHESVEYSMTVYIFGETHMRTTDCPKEDFLWVEDYLRKLFETTDVFIDIYFEFLFPEGITEGSKWQWDDLRLTRLYQTFSNIDNDLVRLHYFDIRTGLKVTNEVSKFEKDVYDLVMSGRENEVQSLLNKPYMKYILDNLSTNPKEFWHNQLERNPKVAKELKKSFLGVQIREFIYILMDIKLDHMVFSVESLLELYYMCIPLNAYITDAYTLARIFKRFKTSVDKPSRPYNVIIYSGEAHAKIYRKFLEWLQFDSKKKISQGEYTSCIDMTTFPMPFFLGTSL